MSDLSQEFRSIVLNNQDLGMPDNTLFVDAFAYSETLSNPFRIDLRCFSESDDLHHLDLIGKKVSLQSIIETHGDFGDIVDHFFNGHVISFTHAYKKDRYTFYLMQLGPWIEFLRHRMDCRIFQNLKVSEILMEVFSALGETATCTIKATSELTEPLTTCTQYNETDLDFASRLMEELGWYYHFEHSFGKHELVIEDDSPGSPAVLSNNPLQPPGTIFFDDGPEMVGYDRIDKFYSTQDLVSNKVGLKTFDFKNPRDPLRAATESILPKDNTPTLDWYQHRGPYAYKQFEAGEDLALLRMEQIETTAESFRGGGSCQRMAPGRFFKLKGHWRDDGEYVVVSVQSQTSNNFFNQNSRHPFRNTFTAIRRPVPFRCPIVTPRPIMRGPQTAIVVGKKGDKPKDDDEILCDEFGRIRVQFHWDRQGEFNDRSFCYVRLAMPWAGDRFGFISIPRVGQEVLVDFLGGDPDRPVVVGSLYNADHMPPWDLPKNKTQTGIQSRSSKGGARENANALRFEDKRHQEEVLLHAERNLRTEVEADESHSVGHDRKQTVGNDETITIEKNRDMTIHGQNWTTVDKDNFEVTKGKKEISIYKNSSLNIKGTSYEEIGSDGGDKISRIHGNLNINVDKDTKFDSKANARAVLENGWICATANQGIELDVNESYFAMKKTGHITISSVMDLMLEIHNMGIFIHISPDGTIEIKSTVAVNINAPIVNLNS